MSNNRELLELAAKAIVKKERHGMNKSPEHRAWVQMKQRCTNEKKRDFKYYGGRGVKVFLGLRKTARPISEGSGHV